MQPRPRDGTTKRETDLAEDRKPARGAPPITWHPLFPAVVAVWFGALFGLGALAVHASLLESLVLASGIDSLVPAAAPPLGVTARILIALALAVLGGIIGAVIGTLLARSKPAARARRAEAAAARAAARAAEAEAQLAATPTEPALALEFAEAPNFIDFSQLEIAAEDRIETGPALEAAADEPIAASAQDFSRPLDPVSFPLPASFPAPGGAAAARLTSATLDSLSHVELIERLALSLQKRREEAEARAALGEAPAESAEEFPDAEAPPLPPVPSYYPPAPEGFAARFAALAPALAASAADPIAEPVALFPEQPHTSTVASQHNPDGTERALRDALAALQRMSGAA